MLNMPMKKIYDNQTFFKITVSNPELMFLLSLGPRLWVDFGACLVDFSLI